jgi:hypothetical protein
MNPRRGKSRSSWECCALKKLRLMFGRPQANECYQNVAHVFSPASICLKA